MPSKLGVNMICGSCMNSNVRACAIALLFIAVDTVINRAKMAVNIVFFKVCLSLPISIYIDSAAFNWFNLLKIGEAAFSGRDWNWDLINADEQRAVPAHVIRAGWVVGIIKIDHDLAAALTKIGVFDRV